MLVYLSILSALAAGATYIGGETDDTIHGTEGDDTVDGGAGEDLIYGDLGNDILDGGADWDWIEGGAGDDIIADSDGADQLFGGAGNDILLDSGSSQGGVDYMSGGAGNDLLHEGADTGNGISLLDGGEGDDILYTEKAGTMFVGGEGADIFVPFNAEGAQSGAAAARFEDFAPGEDVAAIHLEGSATPEDYWFDENEDGTLVLMTDQYAGTPLDAETTIARFEGLSLGQVTMDDLRFLSGDELTDLLGSQGEDGPTLPGGGDDTTGGGGEGGPVIIDPTDVTGADQTLDGSEFDDEIRAGFGNDSINGFAGDDRLVGDDGSDTIDGDAGRDTIYAGDGNDLVRVEGAYNEVFGNDGDDILWTTGGGVMTGGGGEDYFLPGDDLTVITDFDATEDQIVVPFAAGGDYAMGADPETGDAVLLREGDVILQLAGVAAGAVSLSDVVFLDEEETYAFLNSQGAAGPVLPETETPTGPTEGDDTLVGTPGEDTISGLGGNDSISGGDGHDRLNGDAGDDTIFGEGGSDVLTGGTGEDYLYGGAGDDVLDQAIFASGGDGDDVIYGLEQTGGTTTLNGDAGDDLIDGEGSSNDLIDGGSGDDNIYGADGNDTIFAGTGSDIIDGGAGEDVLINRGETGRTNDTLIGGDGNDVVINEAGVGVLMRGGAGDDILVSDDYWNTLEGGEGADIFVAATSQATSTIYPGPLHNAATDFDPAEDTLVIRVDPESFADEQGNYSFRYDDSGATLIRYVFSPSSGPIPDELIRLNGQTEADITLDDVHFMAADDLDDLIASQGEEGPTLPDALVSGPDFNVVEGTDGADTLAGTGGDDVILGRAAGDLINAGDGDDLIGPGTDVADESLRQTTAFVPQPNSPYGGYMTTVNPGVERVDPDVVNGDAGDDTIVGGGHDLDAFGGAGDDLLVSGDAGISRLDGGAGDDTLVGEGGTTAERVNTFNNSRNVERIISEWSALNGDEGDDTIVTAENTFSSGGAGDDTFILRDPDAEGVAARWNMITDLNTQTETLVITYTGETPPEPEDVTFNSVRWRDLPEGSFVNPTRVLAIEVNGETYGYVSGVEGDNNFVYSAPSDGLQSMLDNGQIVFMHEDEVDALQAAAAARTQLEELSGPQNVG